MGYASAPLHSKSDIIRYLSGRDALLRDPGWQLSGVIIIPLFDAPLNFRVVSRVSRAYLFS
jgi:hypothetical protein